MPLSPTMILNTLPTRCLFLDHLPRDCLSLISEELPPFSRRMFSMSFRKAFDASIGQIRSYESDVKIPLDDVILKGLGHDAYSTQKFFVEFFIEGERSFFKSIEIVTRIFTRKNTAYGRAVIWYIMGYYTSSSFIKDSIDFFHSIGVHWDPESMDNLSIALTTGAICSNRLSKIKSLEKKGLLVGNNIIVRRAIARCTSRVVSFYLVKSGLFTEEFIQDAKNEPKALLSAIILNDTFDMCGWMLENGFVVGGEAFSNLFKYKEVTSSLIEKLLVDNRSFISMVLPSCVRFDRRDLYEFFSKKYPAECVIDLDVFKMAILHHNQDFIDRCISRLGPKIHIDILDMTIRGKNRVLFDKILDTYSLGEIVAIQGIPEEFGEQLSIEMGSGILIHEALSIDDTYYIERIVKKFRLRPEMCVRYALTSPESNLNTATHLIDTCGVVDFVRDMLAGNWLEIYKFFSETYYAVLVTQNTTGLRILENICRRALTKEQQALIEVLPCYIIMKVSDLLMTPGFVPFIKKHLKPISFAFCQNPPGLKISPRKVKNIMIYEPHVIAFICQNGYKLTKKNAKTLMASNDIAYTELVGEYYHK